MRGIHEDVRPKIGTRLASSIAAAALASGLVVPGAASAAGSGIPVSATEGAQFSGPVATFNHPVQSATIGWGDGGTSTFFSPNGSNTVTGTHTYAEEGSYGVTVTETTCGQQPCDQASTTASVADAALSASGTSITATSGSPFSGPVATFSDSDPQATAGDYAATIDWGDGSSSAGSIRAASGGGFEVDGSHTYSSGGSYSVHARISDQGGASTTASANASVATAPAKASFTSSTTSPRLGQLVSFDASSSKSGGASVWRYDWLVDGKQAATCDGRTSMLRTRFPTPGSKTITLIATDATGQQTSASQSILVGLASDRPPRDGPAQSAFAAQVRGGKLKVIKVQPVYECVTGAADTFRGAIEALAPQELGAACVNQVEAGIVQVDGCLTEHQDSLGVLIQYVGPFLEETPRQTQPLDGIPNAEAFTFEGDIALQFSKNPHNLCSKLPKKYRELLCPVLPGADSEAPPSLGDSSGPCGAPPLDPCPPGVPPHKSARDRALAASVAPWAHDAALKGVSSPNVAIQTPCNYDIQPKPGQSGFVYPCFQLFVSTTPVVINGLTYKPAPGAVILVSPEFNLVISSRASTWLGKIKIHDYQEINYQLPATLSDPYRDFPALDVANVASILSQPEAQKPAEAGGLGSLGGFDTTGSLHSSFGDHSSTITFQVALPAPITDGSGGPVTAKVTVVVNPDGSSRVTSALLRDANVFFGPIAVKHFSACWRLHATGDDPCPSVTGIPEDPSFGDSFWDATGELDIGSVKLIFSPPGPAGATCPAFKFWGIGFTGGRLDFAAAALHLGASGIPIAPGVNLTDIGAAYRPLGHATSFCGYMKFDVAGGLASLVGQLFLVWVDPGYQYTFTGSELGAGPNMPPGNPYTNHLALGAGGTIYVNFPVLGSVSVAGGYLLYVDDPASAFFGANFQLSLPGGHGFDDDFTGIVVGGGLNGAIGLGHGYPFWLEGHVDFKAKVDTHIPVVGAIDILKGSVKAVLSHSDNPANEGGIAACGEMSWFHVPTPSVGIGVHWNDSLGDLPGDVHVGACDWVESFKVPVEGARDARTGGAAPVATVRVPRGSTAVDVYLKGNDGAPDVTVTGPGLTTSTTGLSDSVAAHRGSVMMVRSGPLKLTVLALLHPHAGVYRVRTNPGSVAVVSVRQANGITPSVRARVTGRGFTRTLRYTIARHPGQSIVFLEQSRQTRRILGSVAGGQGVLKFSAPAGSGRRSISAEVFEYGRPMEVVPVTSYQPSRPQHLGNPRRVSVRRRDARATISFTAVPHATGYAVRVLMRDGMREVFVTRKRAITVAGLFPEFGGRTDVRALGDGVNYLPGRARSAGIPPAAGTRPPAKPPKRRRRH